MQYNCELDGLKNSHEESGINIANKCEIDASVGNHILKVDSSCQDLASKSLFNKACQTESNKLDEKFCTSFLCSEEFERDANSFIDK